MADGVFFVLAYFLGGKHSEYEGIIAYVEPIVILVILILNAIVVVWQESYAESVLEALKELQFKSAHALSNIKMCTSDSSDIVPGDITDVKVGDCNPADTRVVELKTTSPHIYQSQLTGESQSVAKTPEIPT